VKTVLALGNPGERYRDTRHNVGWWLADRLASAWSLPGFARRDASASTRGERAARTVQVVKPLTYVNRAGSVVAELVREQGLEPAGDLLVLVDDVDLPPGDLRLRARGSAGGHNGLASVEEALGSREYSRLRIGVGRPPDDRVDLADWVLSAPTGSEEEAVVGCFDRAVDAVECWLEHGVEEAMNRFN
jgi:PTH1 family peptidyl-tRNA hydrolase